MYNKVEMWGAGISVMFMALALYLAQTKAIWFSAPAAVVQSQEESEERDRIVVVGQSANVQQARADALLEAANEQGKLSRMVIDDIKIGVGEEVKEGDTVAVHYKGTLQNGQEFDSSYNRGVPFEFKVGGGQVIEGWEKGLVGMKQGGQRVLVVPPEMAYGDQGIGPIPGGATLVFAIELIEIK
jgi:FKBP-type peptidyl-prolyl cis-trans isomerase